MMRIPARCLAALLLCTLMLDVRADEKASTATGPVRGEPPASGTPQVLDHRMTLELVAREPDIVTPVGLTFDHHGRLLVIESHTHFAPDDYDGPRTDRIRLVEDTDLRSQ